MRLRMVFTLLLSLTLADMAAAQSLRGSSASMRKQNLAAKEYDYTFLKTSGAVNRFVERGYLVEVFENADLEIHNVSHPYARQEVKLLLERLGAQYRNACGEKLTVTSLTRPINNQPDNASSRSVHPTGMAVDLRVPYGKCRSWLESTLLYLERAGVLDVTRERYPPHYHVAVYTRQYGQYVARITADEQNTVASGSTASNDIPRPVEHTVRRGESLARIAQLYDTSIDDLRAANGIRGDLIRAGQTLKLPGEEPAPDTRSDEQLLAGETTATNIAATPVIDEAPEQPQQASLRITAGDIRNVLTEHSVRRGESLARIAEQYGISISALQEANDLPSDLIRVAQKLLIPRPADTHSVADGADGQPAANADDYIEVGPVQAQSGQAVAAVPAGTPEPEAAVPGVREHTVRRGENLARIAEEYNTSISRLRTANSLPGDLIRVGQTLQIPVADNAQLAAVTELTHEVRRGETLWSIASLYGLSVNRIQSDNAMSDSLLQVGQSLLIRLNAGSN